MLSQTLTADLKAGRMVDLARFIEAMRAESLGDGMSDEQLEGMFKSAGLAPTLSSFLVNDIVECTDNTHIPHVQGSARPRPINTTKTRSNRHIMRLT